MHNANIVAFIKTHFLRPVLTLANTPFMFFAFPPLFPLQDFLFLPFLDSWGVYATLHKILDTLDKKPQRNVVKLLFHSDDDFYTRSGWSLNWTAVTPGDKAS